MRSKRLIWILVALILVVSCIAAEEEALAPRINLIKLFINIFVIFVIFFLVQLFVLKNVIKDEKQKKFIYLFIVIAAFLLSWIYGRSDYFWEGTDYARYIGLAFFVNSIVIGLILYVLYSFVGEKYQPKGNGAKFGVAVLILILGIAFAVNLYNSPSGQVNGKPAYLWQTNWWATGRDYLFGAEGILKGSNLTVFILAFFLFLWIFHQFLSGTDGKGGLPGAAKVGLAIMLGAQISHSGYTVKGFVEMAYWVVLVIIYSQLKKGSENNKSWGIQFGLYWAILDIIADTWDVSHLRKFEFGLGFFGRFMAGLMIGKLISGIGKEGGMLRKGLDILKERIGKDIVNKIGKSIPVVKPTAGYKLENYYKGFMTDTQLLANKRKEVEDVKKDIKELTDEKDRLIREIKDLVKEWRVENNQLRDLPVDNDPTSPYQRHLKERESIWNGPRGADVTIGAYAGPVDPNSVDPLSLNQEILKRIIGGNFVRQDPNTGEILGGPPDNYGPGTEGAIQNAVRRLFTTWRVIREDLIEVDPNCAIGKKKEKKKDLEYRETHSTPGTWTVWKPENAERATRVDDMHENVDCNNGAELKSNVKKYDRPAVNSINGLSYKISWRLFRILNYDTDVYDLICKDLNIPNYFKAGSSSPSGGTAASSGGSSP